MACIGADRMKLDDNRESCWWNPFLTEGRRLGPRGRGRSSHGLIVRRNEVD